METLSLPINFLIRLRDEDPECMDSIPTKKPDASPVCVYVGGGVLTSLKGGEGENILHIKRNTLFLLKRLRVYT